MFRRFGTFSFLALAAAVVSTAGLPAAPDALQKGGDRTVFAAVVDNTGRPTRDLTKADWLVREDGKDRAVVDAKLSTDPMAISLLVDTTSGTRDSITDIRSGVGTFVKAILAGSPTSTVNIISVSGNPTVITDFSSSPVEFDKALPKIFPDQAQAGVMLESIVDAGKHLGTMTTGRRVIVALNLEGFPEASGVSPANVANTVITSGASLWAVSYRNAASRNVSAVAERPISADAGGGGATGRSAAQGGSAGGAASAPAGANRDVILTGLTKDTGGARVTVGVSSAIEVSLTQVANVLLSQYAVTYTRPDGSQPKTLLMATARPGAHVLASRFPPK